MSPRRREEVVQEALALVQSSLFDGNFKGEGLPEMIPAVSVPSTVNRSVYIK